MTGEKFRGGVSVDLFPGYIRWFTDLLLSSKILAKKCWKWSGIPGLYFFGRKYPNFYAFQISDSFRDIAFCIFFFNFKIAQDRVDLASIFCLFLPKKNMNLISWIIFHIFMAKNGGKGGGSVSALLKKIPRTWDATSVW